MSQGQQSRPVGVVVLGGINMDLVAIAPRFPEAGETVVGSRFMTYPGGKGANQAVAAARMGARTTMVGCVGDDMFGPQLKDAMAASGVDVSGVALAPGASSGIAVIEIDGSAQNRIIQVPGANDSCGEPEAQRVALAMAEHPPCCSNWRCPSTFPSGWPRMPPPWGRRSSWTQARCGPCLRNSTPAVT